MHENITYKILLNFSLSRLDSLYAMERLGIKYEEDLFLLMAQAHLPMPRLSKQDTKSMVTKLNHLLSS